jgi:hypothetical protein
MEGSEALGKVSDVSLNPRLDVGNAINVRWKRKACHKAPTLLPLVICLWIFWPTVLQSKQLTPQKQNKITIITKHLLFLNLQALISNWNSNDTATRLQQGPQIYGEQPWIFTAESVRPDLAITILTDSNTATCNTHLPAKITFINTAHAHLEFMSVVFHFPYYYESLQITYRNLWAKCDPLLAR